MENNKTFLGMTIEGSIYHGDPQVPQLSKEVFQSMLKAVLDHDEVLGLTWTQYTPYFNDGDPCVFCANDVYVCLNGVEPNEDNSRYLDYGWMEDDLEENGRLWLSNSSDDYVRLVGDNTRKYLESKDERGWRKWEHEVNLDSQPNPGLFQAYELFDTTLNRGSFNSVLLGLFGDHCTVIIDKVNNKILVDEYEHD